MSAATDVLDDILQRFHLERIRREATANQDPDPDRCRYCGKWWRKWNGSRLDGHAKCVVGSEFKQYLRTTLMHTSVSFMKISERLGVTESVVRSWVFPERSIR